MSENYKGSRKTKYLDKVKLDMLFIDYGEIEHLLVSYKLGKITLEETKRYLRYIINLH
jgi:hypothetical protein